VKKLFLLLFISLFVLQTESFAFLRLGIKAGVNFAKVSVSNSNDVSYQHLPGFSAGVQADVALLPSLSIRTDVLYVQKGSKFTALNESGKIKLDEFVVAPFLVLRLPLPKVIPFLQIGPEVGLNTLAKEESGGTTVNAGPHWKKSDFSLNLGAGVILPLGASDITVDARYNLGLANINNISGAPTTKMNGIQIFLGYNFFKI
jgi:hypothetical protein